MSFLLLFLGLLPVMLLPDAFGSDDTDDVGNGTGGDNGVLQPDDTDDVPPDTPGTILDGILSPDDTDDSPDDYDHPVGDGDVTGPNDTPEEEYYIDGDGSLLQQLLGENSDATTGIGFLGTQISDTDDTELGPGDDTFALDDDGIDGTGEGTLGSWDGTALIDTDGVLNVLDGGVGNDTISTGDAAAYVFGGDGGDTISLGEGAAAVYGGAGEDNITGSDVVNPDGTASAYLDGGIGNDVIIGGDGHEVILGGEHGDPAQAGDDILSGGGGNDIVSGGYGADTLSGGDGDDVINHLGHADELVVDEQRDFGWHIDDDADVLDGGVGDDHLIFDRADTATGGSGNDTFWLYHDSASGVGYAEITDFAVGEDFLHIDLNPDAASGTPEVSVEPSADGNDGIVTVNGEVVAILLGTPGATIADVYVEIQPNLF